MKRLLRVLGVLILILVAAMLLLPIVFKDEIIARAKLEVNENLNAKVEFKDISLSLFRSFPDFTLGISNITIDGVEGFEGHRLAEIDRFQLDLDLMSVLSGNQFVIEKILIADAQFHIILDSEGKANYDIVKPSEEVAETTEAEEAGTFKLSLKNYTLKNIDLVYDDPAGSILVNIQKLDHTGNGDFTQNMVSLNTETTIKAITFGYEGINYLSSVNAEMDADFMYDQNSEVITFGENLLTVNDLPLEFTGALSFPEEKVAMDLSFQSPSEDIKKMLSLIPAIYVEAYEDMKASGSFQFSGTVKGEYDYGDQYPQYDLNLGMQNGSFSFPDLPASVNAINIEARVYNNTTQLEGVEINVPVAKASIGGNPIEARIMLSDPMGNPKFDVGLLANLDMAVLSSVLPMEGYDFKGKIDAQVVFTGDLEAVEEERYQDIKAEGFLEIDSLKLAGDSMPQVMTIGRAKIGISPQYLDVQEFVMLIGQSDFRMRGRVDNILNYMLKDEILVGRFSLDADMINLNELSASEEGEEATDDSTASLSAVRLPKNIDFELSTSIRQLVYDDLMINDVVGQMTVAEGVASMKQLDMRLLGGRVRMSGSYNSVPDQPAVDMSLDLRNFDIRESYQKLGTLRKLAPIMKSSSGIFNTKLSFKALMNSDMSPNLESINASGGLTAKSLSTSPKVMQQLGDILNNPKMSVMAIKDLNVNYRVKGGRVEVDPFNLTSGSLKSVVSGSMGLDQSLDYTMDVSIPLKDIGAANLLSQLGTDPNQKVDVKVLIGGTASDPKITTSLKDIGGSIVDQAVEEIKKKIEDVVDDAVDDAVEQANAKAAQLIADAEKKGDELIATAEKQGDALVAEAEKQAAQIREEANKQARKLEDDAKGNFLAEKGAKIGADKLRAEADKRASQLVVEARKNANKVVESARQQKVKLVEEAQEKAKI